MVCEKNIHLFKTSTEKNYLLKKSLPAPAPENEMVVP